MSNEKEKSHVQDNAAENARKQVEEAKRESDAMPRHGEPIGAA